MTGGFAADGPRAAPLVLVVEDEFLIAMEIEDVLTSGGYGVLGPASTVAMALGLLDGETPDAAVLDVNLGKERVTPVAQALAAKSIPFLLASAYWPGDLANEPLLANAVNVGKPTSSPRLLAEIARLLVR